MTTTFAYRPDRLRNSKTTSGVTTNFTYGASGEVLDDGSAKYVYGAGMVDQKTNGGVTYYYLADGLGSTMKTVDQSANVVNAYTCDVYGKTTSSSGSQANTFQFAGQQTDSTGLQYLSARYYDPATGTFLSRDPMAAGPAWGGNPFAYASGGPTNATDPTGLFDLPPDIQDFGDPSPSAPSLPPGCRYSNCIPIPNVAKDGPQPGDVPGPGGTLFRPPPAGDGGGVSAAEAPDDGHRLDGLACLGDVDIAGCLQKYWDLVGVFGPYTVYDGNVRVPFWGVPIPGSVNVPCVGAYGFCVVVQPNGEREQVTTYFWRLKADPRYLYRRELHEFFYTYTTSVCIGEIVAWCPGGPLTHHWETKVYEYDVSAVLGGP